MAVAIAGAVGSIVSMRLCMPDLTPGAAAPPRASRPLGEKPLVVILLGDTQSDVTDVLAPYALFAEAGSYEVRTLASSGGLRTLTGGLEVVPDLTFAELARARPRGPDVIVVPAILEVETEANRALRTWLARAARRETQVISWCTGAEVLAASGLLDGRPATAHWADLPRLEDAYPRVRWTRGARYVSDGNVIASGGLTFGIDATLALIAARDGEDVARRVASVFHATTTASRRLTPTEPRPSDAVYLLAAAFYFPKRHVGLYLYDGVSEMDLAAVLDTHAASFTYVVHTLGAERVVHTAHGLRIAPRAETADVERVLVPTGREAPDTTSLGEATRTYLPRDRSAFTAAVEDLAVHAGPSVGAFAARRLELRSRWQRPETTALPLRFLLVPLIAVLVVILAARRRGRAKSRAEDAATAAPC